MCDWKPETGYIADYKCTHKYYGKNKDGTKDLCIFHSDKDDKDSGKFYQGIKKIYKSGKHDFSGFVFPKEFDFLKLKGELKVDHLFFTDANFSESVFLCKVILSESKFAGQVGTSFSGAEFSGDGGVCFTWAEFFGEGMTDFSGVQFSGKGLTNFDSARFSNEGGTYFIGAEFSGKDGTDFSAAQFSGEDGPDFSLAQFSGKGRADFRAARFSGLGVTDFKDTQFSNEGGTYFIGTEFSGGGGASFFDSQFFGQGEVDFSGARFSGEGWTDFNRARFSLKGVTSFNSTQFLCQEGTSFREATFSSESGTDFSNSVFSAKQGLNFSLAEVKGNGQVRFNSTQFQEGTENDFRNISIQNPGTIVFDNVYLGHSRFLGTNLSLIVFNEILWNRPGFRELISRRAMVYDEVFQKGLLFNSKGEKDHYHVYLLYNQLRLNYERTGRHLEAGDFHIGQMEMWRKGKFNSISNRYFLFIYKWLSLYGERPIRALVWLSFTPLFFSCLYLFTGLTVRLKDGHEKIIMYSLDELMLSIRTLPNFINDLLSAIQYSYAIITVQRIPLLTTSYEAYSSSSIFLNIMEYVICITLITLFYKSLSRKFARYP
jgi:hypothetical protein